MFQSTPFARRETLLIHCHIWYNSVSIHSLRKKGDQPTDTQLTPEVLFQSTPFARRETVKRKIEGIEGNVSIHSLRKKGDIDIYEREVI